MTLPAFLVPGITEHLLAQTASVLVTIVVEIQLCPFSFLPVEAVRRCANSDCGTTAFKVIHQQVSLIVRQLHETREENEQVSVF